MSVLHWYEQIQNFPGARGTPRVRDTQRPYQLYMDMHRFNTSRHFRVKRFPTRLGKRGERTRRHLHLQE